MRSLPASPRSKTVWLFDLDNTLHDASRGAFGLIDRAMKDYIVRELDLPGEEADRLRRHYWARYGATLLGLVRHHGVRAAHFLHHTHALPGLEAHLRTHARDAAALRALPGRKLVLTNAPRAYARRVLDALDLSRCFDGLLSIEDMRMFGQLRPKPDRRMFRALCARLRVAPRDCILVEDTLVHQKAAHGLGMRTVWMQRWLRGGGHGPEAQARLRRRPGYVCARISALRGLHRLPLGPAPEAAGASRQPAR
jgi:putative hydrolase of the HAD superfamily